MTGNITKLSDVLKHISIMEMAPGEYVILCLGCRESMTVEADMSEPPLEVALEYAKKHIRCGE